MFHLYRNKREKFVLSSADIQLADTHKLTEIKVMVYLGFCVLLTRLSSPHIDFLCRILLHAGRLGPVLIK